MDWESYRTDLEAIKLAVNECERSVPDFIDCGLIYTVILKKEG